MAEFGGNKADLLEFMKEQSVMASYGNHKMYRIHDVDFKRSPMSSFECGNQKMTYVDYFKKQYNLKIKNLN